MAPIKPSHSLPPTTPIRPIAIDTPTQPVSPVGPPPPELRPNQPPKIASTPPARSHSWFFFVIGGLFFSTAALMIVAAFLLVSLYQSDRIMPGVFAAGLDVGGLPTEQATARLQQYWRDRQIIMEGPNLQQAAPAEALGISLDVVATIDQAHRQGRSPESLGELLQTMGHLAVEPIWRFDSTQAHLTLEALAPQLTVPAQGAGLRLVGNQVEMVPAVPGRTLDIPATIAALSQGPAQVINQGRLELVMQPVEPTLTDIGGAAAEANALLADSLVIRGYDPIANEQVQWTVESAQWGTWLNLRVEPTNPPRLNWQFDTGLVDAFLARQSDQLGTDRYFDSQEMTAAVTAALADQTNEARLRVYHRERQHTVQSGETLSSIGYDYGIPYPWIQQANPGLGDALVAGQTITLPSLDLLLPLPIVENKRIVVSLSQQRVWAYENGTVKWDWLASTGIQASPTAPGVFQVQSHELNAYADNWNLWMPNFMGIYRPVPTADFMNGFHGFPTRNNANLLWTGDLGRRVTYGCILISSENAIALYNWAEEGVIVEIQR